MSISRKPRLLFAVESPFSSRDWKRFGIDELNEKFDVLILDLTALSKPALVDSRGHYRLTNERIRSITRESEISQTFSESKPAVLLNNVGVGEIRQRLFIMAKKHNVSTAEFQLGAIPSEPVHSPFTRSVYRLRQLPSLYSLPRAMIQKRRSRRWNNCMPDVFFRAGLKARGQHPLLGASVVDVHSLDYETSLKMTFNSDESTNHRIVYLDQDLGYHSDVAGLGLRHPATPERFYPRINAYFDWLEQEHNCQVIVCPHPRTTRAHAEVRFAGRYISDEETCVEIGHCGAVMGHVSTSFSFAVLSMKPTMILTSSEIAHSWYAPFTKTFSTELAAPLVNLDDRNSWVVPTTTLTQDQQGAYDRYQLNYLKSYDGPAHKLWSMIGETLLQKISG